MKIISGLARSANHVILSSSVTVSKGIATGLYLEEKLGFGPQAEDLVTRIAAEANQHGIHVFRGHPNDFDEALAFVEKGYRPQEVVLFYAEDEDLERFALQGLEDSMPATESIGIGRLLSKETHLPPRNGYSRKKKNHRKKLTPYEQELKEFRSASRHETDSYTDEIGNPQDLLKIIDRKTNWILDVVGFGEDKNLLFIAYEKEVVKQARLLYLGIEENEHAKKALNRKNQEKFREGLVATMESIRTRGYRQTEHDILSEVDIVQYMREKYEKLGSPKMRIRSELDQIKFNGIEYLVGKYIQTKETKDLAVPAPVNITF